MATVASPPAEQAADLLQKFSLDSEPKTLEIPEPMKKPSPNQFGSIDSSNAANGQFSSDRSVTPFPQDYMDPSTCYLPNGYHGSTYYYGGYDVTSNDWDEYSRYLNPDGVEMTSGVYGDNGSLIYHHGYGYAPYGSYSPVGSPVPAIGNDGQIYGPQHYQYPPYFALTPTSAPFTPNGAAAPTQRDVSTSVAADQKPLPVETAKANSNGVATGGNMKGNNGTSPLKPTYQNKTVNSNGFYGGNALSGGTPALAYQDPRYAFDGMRSPIPWLDGPLYTDGQSRPVTGSTISPSISNGNSIPSRSPNVRSNSHFMGLNHPRPVSAVSTTQGYYNRMHPNKLYGHYGQAVRSGIGLGSHGYDTQSNGRAWLAVDNKYKPSGRNGAHFGYGNENLDGLNELNRGPRAKGFKNQKSFTPTVLAVKGQKIPIPPTNVEEKDKTTVTLHRDQYNRADFPVNYSDGRFFIIKSYSEDDVHKSIKYNVWASTPNGNKKLDSAYQEAREKSGCPVFLFFSVNTSGQFVGLAEMVGHVDFHKNLEYWQQDKWNGCFPVKWHIVKDVPNSLLKHITLENNENKPVTNSRDTQEVKLEPALKMIKIFKEHARKTCILDDFGFYEARQKTIQEKKTKQQQFQKQVWEGKPTDEKKTGASTEVKTTQKTLEVASELTKASTSPTSQVNMDRNLSEEESVKTGDVSKAATNPVVSEKRILANGDAC